MESTNIHPVSITDLSIVHTNHTHAYSTATRTHNHLKNNNTTNAKRAI